jgi:hypothetical protein
MCCDLSGIVNYNVIESNIAGSLRTTFTKAMDNQGNVKIVPNSQEEELNQSKI